MKSTIVIADDEPITRMDIFEILTCAGYDVVGEASNGFDAVELCRKYKPDLAIMDVKMPKLDGIKATKLIIDEELVHSVLLLTAYSGIEFIERAKDCGVMGYIVKPIDEKKLIPEIEVAISKGKEIKKMKEDIFDIKKEMEKKIKIDTAKKVLMKKYDIPEEAAYKKIRKESMNSRCSMNEIAELVIEGKM